MTERIDSRFGDAAERQIYQNGKQGSGGTWTAAPAADGWISTVAASQTGAEFMVPLDKLRVGDVIRGYYLMGQIESAGNGVTLDAKLGKHVPAAADVTTTATIVGTGMTQVSVTADTAVNEQLTKTVFSTGNRITVADDETYYAHLTCTTGASTDLAFMGLVLLVDPQR